MSFALQTSQRLHEEHEAVFALLARLERAVSGRGGAFPPHPGDATWSSLLRDLVHALGHEITRHFEFEEGRLFACLSKAGEGDLIEILSEEHRVIVAVAEPLLVLARVAQVHALDRGQWIELKTLGLELCERLTAHAQKEELALLPVIEATLGPQEDDELMTEYAGL